MKKTLLLLLGWFCLFGCLVAQDEGDKADAIPRKKRVYVIPIEGEIASPQLYILRRGTKQALQERADCVVLKMDTPGGALDVTLEMMNVLEHFPNETLTFVAKEALSAGSYIAIATHEIYMAPGAFIGAAAVIQDTGQDMGKTLKMKIDSYLRARIRQLAHKYPYRADVQRAMMDADYALSIDGKEIKSKGELLTLTAKEAMATYGQPPRPLLAEGIANSIAEVLDHKYGKDGYEMRLYDITWSEHLAKILLAAAPVLMALGLLCLAIEFKTPGWGIFGVLGVGFLLLVFISHYIAGLSEWTGVLIFLVGILLVLVEIFFLPGVWLGLFLGLCLILGSLLWGLKDTWPGQGFSWDWSALTQPFYNLLIAFGLLLVGLYFLQRFFPGFGVLNRLILRAKVPTPYKPLTDDIHSMETHLPPVGSCGIAVTGLFPQGEVDIEGKRYPAHLRQGALKAGSSIVVAGYKDNGLWVDAAAERK